jgi:thiosulfate dehydrogenase (quinone) large subunit
MRLMEKSTTLFFRVTLGWLFLYAAYQQISDPNWTAATFLNETKSAHDFFEWFASPARVAITNFAVKWGHLLIGLSLFFGLLTRVGAFFGAVLMFTYYLAHMDFPYVESHDNFIVDYHLVYIGILVHLIITRAGRFVGLDNWLSRSPILDRHRLLLRIIE